jgi:arginine:agmatine antiporter
MQTRKIGPVLATFVVANNMIGSGFFLLPASLAASGAITAFSWIIGTALALMLGGAFARLARDYPNLSSADDYVRPALGRDASFLASTLYWASSWIGNNAIAVAAFGYLVMLLPLDGGDPHVQVAGQIALIWLMFAINLLGPKPVAKFQSLCVVFGLAPVALVLLFGWGSFDRGLYDAAWNVSGKSDAAVVFGSLSPVFWAFVGLETGAMIAGLVRDPDRDVPRATLGGWMLVTGETGARAAQHGYLPAIFGRLNRRGAAGWGLLIIASAMSVIAMVTLSPKVSGQFGVIINIVVNLVVLAYAAAGLSLVVGTRERPPKLRDRLLGIGALVACALLFASSSVQMMLGAAGAMALAWILYRIFGRRG